MPGLNVQVTLSEALEVRAGPLVEPEIWAILCQAAETLQDIFLGGDYNNMTSEGGLGFVISPDTLMLCANGRVTFAESSFDTISNKNVVPPEYSPYIRPSEAALEKCFVFALGMSLYEAADFRLPQHQELTLSERLDAMLCAMCEENPNTRSSLGEILHRCSSYMRHEPYVIPHSHHIIKLYKLVLGSGLSLHTQFTTPDGRMSRPRRRKSIVKRSRSQSRSVSRSRSRTQSRSRSRSRSRHAERPHPVGRDQTPQHRDGHNSERIRSFSSHHSGRSRHSDHYDGKYGSRDSLTARIQDQDRRVTYAIHDFTFEGDKHPVRPRHSSLPRQGQSALHATYNRVIERRKKLQALRYGLDMDDHSDTASGYSEAATDVTDRKSVVSASSHVRGAYRPPDNLPHYGSLGTLNLRGSSSRLDLSAINFIDSSQEEYLRQQQMELEAIRKAAERKKHKSTTTLLSRSMSADALQTVPKVVQPGRNVSRPREFTGPEFVYMSNKARVNLTVPHAHLLTAANKRHVNVVHMTGQRLQVTCGTNTTGRQLYDTVLAHLGLREHYFFGIAYIRDGEHWFLEDDQKLQKVAPAGWKDIGKQGNVLGVSFNLFVRVKYYVDNIMSIRHSESRHLYYLQLRQDVLEERCHVTEDEALVLAGLALQAEYGDRDTNLHPRAYFQPDHYISQRNLRRLGSGSIRDDIPPLHSSHAGSDQEEAEWKFMRHLQQCPEYGIHFYKIYRSKKSNASPLWAGIGVHGILMAEQRGIYREPNHRHPWHFIQKISYNRKRFSITPKSEAGPLKLAKMNYYTDSHRKGRYLLQFCTAQHHFHMKMKMLNVNEMFDQEYPMEAGSGKSGRFEFGDYRYDTSNRDPGVDGYGSFDEYSNEGDQHYQQEEAGYESIRRRQGERDESHNRSRSHHESVEEADSGEDIPDRSGQFRNSTRSQDDTLFSYPDANIRGTAAIGRRSESTHPPEAPERIIQIVELVKEGQDGLGITIVGGENTGKLDLGIFVQSVDADGPAARDGRVQAGDRIIAINGHSLEGMPHHVAVDLIRDSPAIVQLFMSRSKSEISTASSSRDQPIDDDNSSSVDGDTILDHVIASQIPNTYPNQSPVNLHHESPRQGDGQEDLSEALNMSNNRLHRYDGNSSADSSDLELENVIPPDALNSGYVKQHTSSYSPAQLLAPRDVENNNANRMSNDNNPGVSTRDGSDGYVSDVELDEALRSVGEQSKNLILQMRPQTHSLEPGERYDAVLEKRGASLGLNVTGGVNTSVKDGGIYVKSLNENGPALQDGRIRVGDRVLAVNETNLLGVTHRQAVEILRSAPPVCKLSMERGVPPGGSLREYPLNTDSPASNQSSEFRSHDQIDTDMSKRAMDYYPSLSNGSLSFVKLQQNIPNGSFLTVYGGIDYHPEALYQLPRVKQVYPPGRPTVLDHVQIGDILLEVNGESTKGLTYQEIVHLLETSSTDMSLLLLRPPEDILPSVEDLAIVQSQRGTPASQVTSQGTDQSASMIRARGGDPDGASPTTTTVHSPVSPSMKDTKRSVSMTSHTYNSMDPGSDSDSEKDDDSDIGDSASVVRLEQDKQQEPSRQNDHRSMMAKYQDTNANDKFPGKGEKTSGPTTTSGGVRSRQSTQNIADSSSDSEDEVQRTRQPPPPRLDKISTTNTLSPGEFAVSMEKGTKGLGFTVAGGQNTTGYFYVKDILFDPALSDGRIQKGDRLIKVNDQDMTNLNHREAVDYLRMTPNKVTIRFYRPVRVVTPTGNPERRVVQHANSSEPETPSVKPQHYGFKFTERSQPYGGIGGDNTSFKPSNVSHISGGHDEESDAFSEEDELEELEERHRNGMLTPTHSLDPTPTVQLDNNTPSGGGRYTPSGGRYTPSHLHPLSHHQEVDDEDGLRSHNSSWGDMTLPMPDDKNCDEELEQITSGNGDGRVLSPIPGAEEGSVIRVDLDRPDTDSYGFSLVQGETGTNTGLYIRSITPASAAAVDDRLRVGDRLLQVNKASVIGMPHNKAVAMIKKANNDKLSLTVSRSRATPTPSRATPTPSHLTGRSESRGSVQSNEHRYSSDRDSPWSQTGQESDEMTEGFQSMNSSINYTPSHIHNRLEAEEEEESEEGEESEDDVEEVGGLAESGSASKVTRNVPEKPPRSKTHSQLPADINDEWLSEQPIIKMAPQTVHYSGRELEAALLTFQRRIEASDPVEEYKTLRHAKLTDNCNDARKPENKAKNRYRNVLPYDATRVRLSGLDDYINASHVYYTLGKDTLHYIASQGPLPQTTDDFWRMVWEKKSDTIAMVTLDVEGGKIKCHRYWPDSKDTPLIICDNKYEVSLMDVHSLQNFDVHRIKMKDLDSGGTHHVFHVNFTTWPDHGTPDTGVPLLQYLRFLHMVHSSGPMVVHCSAGIGRTGALITVDIGLAQIERDIKLDIHKIVLDLRRQRQGMIQTKDQYVFCYKAAFEALQSIEDAENE